MGYSQPKPCYLCDRNATTQRNSEGVPVCQACWEHHLVEEGESKPEEKKEAAKQEKVDEDGNVDLGKMIQEEIEGIELDWDPGELDTWPGMMGPSNAKS